MTNRRQTSQIPSYQLVGHYGVGAIYELRSHWNDRQAGLHSVMVAGLDFWDTSKLQEIHDPILENILHVKKLYMPSMPDDEGYSQSAIPAVRFPRWLVCTRCHRLGRVPQQFNDENFSGPRCNATGCKGRGVPVRLVVACDSIDQDGRFHGHIDDFPWIEWVHKGGTTCDKPDLRLTVQPGSTALSGLRVSCLNSSCKQYKVDNSLGDVLLDHVKFPCSGYRPWLNDRERCSNKSQVVFRHASNIYFPHVISAVSIPPYSQELYQRLQKTADESIGRLQRDRRRSRETDWDDIFEGLREKHRWITHYTDDEIRKALESLAFVDGESLERHIVNEREALLKGYPESDRSAFVAKRIRSEFTPFIGSIIQSLVQVERLRVVQALAGFHRIRATGIPAELSRRPMDWRPAVEFHGEGIFVEFNQDALASWASQTSIIRRVQPLRNSADPKHVSRTHPISLMLHTVSHLLIKQLSLEAGYGMGSLRERLYIQPEGNPVMAGVLIYVAATSASGTLGGLARQATSERIEELLRGAYDEARWCSSDPLCIETDRPTNDIRNLAACHACCLISETACEWGNQFLDRALIVGLPDETVPGFLQQAILS